MKKRIIDSCVCILLSLVTLTSACQKSEVGVASVTLSQNSLIMRVGQTSSIRANVKPDDATDKTVAWTSSNTGVATVADGVITALKVGSATITAKAGDKSATCAVTVENAAGGGLEPTTEEDLDLKCFARTPHRQVTKNSDYVYNHDANIQLVSSWSL